MSVQLFRKLKHALSVPSGLTGNVSDVFAERKDADRLQESGEMTFFGQIVTRCYTIVSSPLVSLSLSFSVALFPPCALLHVSSWNRVTKVNTVQDTHTFLQLNIVKLSPPTPPPPPYFLFSSCLYSSVSSGSVCLRTELSKDALQSDASCFHWATGVKSAGK